MLEISRKILYAVAQLPTQAGSDYYKVLLCTVSNVKVTESEQALHCGEAGA
jgi:hypothetical protein